MGRLLEGPPQGRLQRNDRCEQNPAYEFPLHDILRGMNNKSTAALLAGFLVFLSAGCGGTVIKTYTRPEAPWQGIQRFAVVPFNLPSENPVERQLITQLFATELHRHGFTDLVEVPLDSPVGLTSVDVTAVGKDYGVDAVFTGSVDEMRGTVVYVRLQDAATEDVLWSGTYALGTRSEYFSFKTQQQQLQRAFEKLARELAQAQAGTKPAPRRKKFFFLF